MILCRRQFLDEARGSLGSPGSAGQKNRADYYTRPPRRQRRCAAIHQPGPGQLGQPQSPGDWGRYGKMSWKPRGDTAIGTYLKSRILEPMIYSQLQQKTLARPYLISVMTDGMPSQEKDEEFVEAIKECGTKLQQAGYPRESEYIHPSISTLIYMGRLAHALLIS